MDAATRVHYIVEAMRRAFRDHNDYLGDPDFVKMPLDMLLSPYYADGLRQSILPDRATPSSMLPRAEPGDVGMHRSEEHTYELQSLMRLSYAVFCLKKKK